MNDSWSSVSGAFNQSRLRKFAGPGHWNDPDMLVVGNLGWGKLRSSQLTPNEQYSHLSLWCLLSAPLLIGCDLAQLDPFTLNLLSNDEVLEVDQDTLGQQAGKISNDANAEIWAKDMEDGSIVVGLFNRTEGEQRVEVQWTDIQLEGPHHVRDLWRQQDLGEFAGSFSAAVPRHGVELVRIW